LAHCLEQEIQGDVDGVVVTHGTDTLEEAAYFIDEVFPPRIPIVVTGAMRPAWTSDYDGSRNLENALLIASAVSGAYGVLVTMNGKIFAAWSVYKADTGALGAFTARRGAPVGRITDASVELNWRPAARQRFGKLPSTLPSSVPILTMGVDDVVLFDRLASLPIDGADCGYGCGSIPPVALIWVRAGKNRYSGGACSSAMSGRTAEEEYYPGKV
jgi:L-asparaginase